MLSIKKNFSQIKVRPYQNKIQITQQNQLLPKYGMQGSFKLDICSRSFSKLLFSEKTSANLS